MGSMINNPNQSFSRYSRQSLELSLSNNDPLNSSMHNLNPMPEFSMSTTPRYDIQRYQNPHLAGYMDNVDTKPSPRYSKPQNYSKEGFNPHMTATQSAKVIQPLKDSTPERMRVPSSSNQFNPDPMAKSNTRMHYKPQLGARVGYNPAQTQFYQGAPSESQTNTLRQSLNLIKMATNLSQKSSGNYSSMTNTTVPQHFYDMPPMQRGYGGPVRDDRYYAPPQYMQHRVDPRMDPNASAEYFQRQLPNMRTQNVGSFHSQNTVPTPDKVPLDPNYYSPDFNRGRLMCF